MYPRLSDLFSDFLGVDLPFPIYSFGAMVAIGILAAAWLTGRELDRLHAAGLISSVKVEKKSPKGKKRTVTENESPSSLIGTLTVLAVVGGFGGSKLFYIIENLDRLGSDPLAAMFSSGGFTFYGGLIVATILIVWYIRRKGLQLGRFTDAIAPGLILAYGIGRIGCHLAGDGDWGIPSNVAAKPGWLPEWLWAETYPNNILSVDLSAQPVYPTPIYEFVVCVLLFALLFALRKHPYAGGWLFFLYLVLNGTERFLVEIIRVNERYDIFGLAPSQAQIIAVVLFVIGIGGLVVTSRRRRPAAEALSAA